MEPVHPARVNRTLLSVRSSASAATQHLIRRTNTLVKTSKIIYFFVIPYLVCIGDDIPFCVSFCRQPLVQPPVPTGPDHDRHIQERARGGSVLCIRRFSAVQDRWSCSDFVVTFTATLKHFIKVTNCNIWVTWHTLCCFLFCDQSKSTRLYCDMFSCLWNVVFCDMLCFDLQGHCTLGQ